MVRFSFLVGGGQKMRQKYDADCGKHMSTALRAIGFEEDRGASEDLACQGSFKQAHDTDKNIMTMHIFPRIEIIEDEDGGGGDEGSVDWKNLPPEYLVTVCSPAAFKHLAKAKTPSWSQKKRMLDALKEMHGKYEAVRDYGPPSARFLSAPTFRLIYDSYSAIAGGEDDRDGGVQRGRDAALRFVVCFPCVPGVFCRRFGG